MKKFIWLTTAIYGIGLCLVALLPFWPTSLWWLANIIQVGPLWIFAFPLGLLLLIAILLRNKRLIGVNVFLVIVLLFGIMGYKLSPQAFFMPTTKPDVRIMTVNAGGKMDVRALVMFIQQEQPDVVTIEESISNLEIIIKQFLPEWKIYAREHLTILTRWQIHSAEVKNRRVLNGWGGVVGRYEIEGPFGRFFLYNVHLETPREAVDAVLSKKLEGIEEAKRVLILQEKETAMALGRVPTDQPVIIAGDFNMTQANPIYQTYWSRFTNTFSKAGNGFGYTKFTRWHGVRIDHTLVNGFWRVQRCFVGPDLGGDHRPVVTELVLSHKELVQALAQQKPESDIQSLPLIQTSLMRYDFEQSKGGFKPTASIDMSLDITERMRGNQSLKIQAKGGEDLLLAGLGEIVWPLDQFPNLYFAYKIPKGTPVSVIIKTQMGDWICVGLTAAGKCSFTKLAKPIILIDDDQWHEVIVDMKESVHSILPSMTHLKSLNFFIDQNRLMGDHFWIDDFIIYN